MVLIILVALCCAFGVWFVASDRESVLACLASVCSAMFSVIAIIAIFVSHCDIPGRIAHYHERYESLTYQLESGMYENDNDVGKKELVNEITAWNEDLAYYKVMQNDLWIGQFIPNIYDAFEFIDIRVVENF